jgi:hypothetical protein
MDKLIISNIRYLKNSKIYILCLTQLSTSTSSRSSISGLATKRLTSTPNEIIYYYAIEVTETKSTRLCAKNYPFFFNLHFISDCEYLGAHMCAKSALHRYPPNFHSSLLFLPQIEVLSVALGARF